MLPFLKFIASVAVAASALSNRESVAFPNPTAERHPQKMVELIELTLPRNSKEGGGKTGVNSSFGPSGDEPRYEIFIRPNRNNRVTTDPRKIKIFLETEGYGNDTFAGGNQDSRPLPLTIHSVGSNVDVFQLGKEDGKVRPAFDRRFDDPSSPYPSKREAEAAEPLTVTSSSRGFGAEFGKSERKDARSGHQAKAPLASTGAPGGGRTDPFRDEGRGRIRGFAASDGAEVESGPTREPPRQDLRRHRPQEPGEQRTRPVDRRQDTPGNADFRQKPYLNAAPAERHQENRFAPESETDRGVGIATGESLFEGEARSGRPWESSANGEVVRRRHPFDVEPDSSGTVGTGLPYEIVGQVRPTGARERGSPRPVRQDSYLGFPETYTSDMRVSQRPTSEENADALPARSCPGIFKYTTRGTGRWYADIYVTTDEVLDGMRLGITLDRPADVLTADAAEVRSRDNVHFTVLSLKKRLIPGSPETVRIMVKYNDRGPASLLQAISLNGRTICPSRTSTYPKSTTKRPVYVFPGELQEQNGPTERNPDMYAGSGASNEFASSAWTTVKPSGSSKKTAAPPPESVASPNPDAYEGSTGVGASRPATKKPNPHRPDFANSKPPGLSGVGVDRRPGGETGGHREALPSGGGGASSVGTGGSDYKPNDREKREIPCGLPAVQPRPLITNGQTTTRGQWPWHAALYKSVGPNLSYACGGSLITDLHVITAAHCVTIEHTSNAVDPKMLLVYLGKFHLYVWNEHGISSVEVSRVQVHPNYNATDFQSDLAILTLQNRVKFNDFIRPVCLWDRTKTRIEDVVGRIGTVVGWGFDEGHKLTEELKQAKMPVVKQNECLWSYPDFYPKFTSNKTYCAGFKNGTSACNGDSGGGMVFPMKVDREERWFLRGLVSLSPAVKNIRVCDSQHYVIFTDVAKYLPWVEDLISQG